MPTRIDHPLKPTEKTRPDLAQSDVRPMVAKAHAAGVGFFVCLPNPARSIRSF